MKNWSYRTRNIALLILLPVMLILGYFLSFSKSIELYQENTRLESYEGQELNLPLKIASVNKRIQRLDSLISINQFSYQSRLINTASDYCDRYSTTLLEAKVVDFKQYENLPYESYKLKLEGKYSGLLKVLDDVEHNFGLGKVQSATFSRELNRKTKRTSLTLTIYLTRVVTSEKSS